MNEKIVDLGYAAGWRLARALPLPVARGLFNAGADRSARKRGPGVTRLARNLRHVVDPSITGDAFDEIVRRGMRSYARYWMEAFRLPSYSPEQLRTALRVTNREVLAEAVAAGKGLVLALPHAGNWDVAGAWAAAQGWGISTVAQRLRPESLFERFVAFRESLGMEILPLSGGERPPLDVLAERLGQGWVVPLLADRDLSVRGVDVRFFGGTARMPAGPALLALRTGAPLFTVDMWFCEDTPCAQLRSIPLPGPDEGRLDARVRLVTQRVADALAAGIAAHPQDWHMLQKIWIEEPATWSGPPLDAASPARAGS